MVNLQERLDEFKKSFESGAPPYNAPHEVIETMHRATAELKATGIEHRALKVGDRAEGFCLFSQDHVQIDSADLLPARTPSRNKRRNMRTAPARTGDEVQVARI